jgi:nucleoside-diphosphate-sugar epimerase
VPGRVAIVGAGGFVGARFVELAVLGGDSDVVPIVRAVRSVARYAHLGISSRSADASRPASLATALEGCDVVIDLTKGDPADIVRTTASVQTAASAVGARLVVHLSSAVVYGRVDRPGLPDDTPPRLDHRSPYARQKALAENFLRERMTDARPAVVVLRPSLIWGPGSPYVLGSASDLLRGAAGLVGGGAGICDLMYVDNLVRSIQAVIADPGPASGFFHVGDDETTTWREFYLALATGLGLDPATIRGLPDGEFRPGLRDRLQDVQGLGAYRWLKDRVPNETRAAIKLRLARRGDAGVGLVAGDGAPPRMTRELWELQRTRYRLPTERFHAVFGRHNSATFETGMAASVAWLRFIGVVGRDAPGMAVPSAVS